jgi:vacuolar-type H+-ATPase subunit E/Vma4
MRRRLLEQRRRALSKTRDAAEQKLEIAERKHEPSTFQRAFNILSMVKAVAVNVLSASFV